MKQAIFAARGGLTTLGVTRLAQSCLTQPTQPSRRCESTNANKITLFRQSLDVGPRLAIWFGSAAVQHVLHVLHDGQQ